MAKQISTSAYRPLVGLLALLLSVAPDVSRAKESPTCFGRAATIVVAKDAKRARGTSGNDVIVSRGKQTKVYGLQGDDLMCSLNGGDLLYGGPGDDKLQPGLYLNPHNEEDYWEGEAYGGRGQDLLTNDSVSLLYGGPGNDRLVGAGLSGGRGDDTLVSTRDSSFSGGPGDDLLRGSGGDEDTATFEGADAGIVVDLEREVATGSGSDVLIGIENVVGTDFDDVIKGTERDHSDHSYDLGPSNEIDGGGGADRLVGRGGGDNIAGEDGRDVVLGGAGDDFLSGTGPSHSWEPDAEAPDLVVGGSGDDFIIAGGEQGSVVRAGAGNDRILGSNGPDEIYGDDGDDEVRAFWGNDVVYGGPGDDHLSGWADSRLASSPYDTGSRDAIDGGAGTDRCFAGEKYEGCEWID